MSHSVFNSPKEGDTALSEGELLDQVELFAELSGMARVGLWQFDPRTGEGSWTAEVARIHEVDPSTQTSADFGVQFYRGEHRQRIEQAIHQAIHSGQSYDLELELITAKGNRKWVRTKCQPIIRCGETVELRGVIQDITDRKNTEHNLQVQRDLMQSYLDTAQVILMALDRQGNIIMTNRAGCELIGCTQEELLGRNWFDMVLPQRYGGDATPPFYLKAMNGQLPWPESITSELIRGDGSTRFLSWRTSQLRDKPGNVIGAICSGQDITEQEMSHKALKENEEKLQLFIEHAPAALAMLDRDMRYLAASQRWMTDFGLGEQNIIGQSHYDIFPEIPAEWKELHRRAMADAVVRKDEMLFQRMDGSRQWVHGEIVPWHTSSGEIGGIILFSEDVTKTKEFTEQIEDRERRYRAILGSTIEGFMVLSKDGRLSDVNDSLINLIGYSREELLGMHISDLDATESQEEADTHIQKIIEVGHDRFETFFRSKSGRIWPAEVAVSYVPDQNGLHFAFVLDISQRKQAEEDIKAYIRRLEASMEGTLLAVANMVEQRDPYTAGHERRVGLIAADIAREMGWSEDKCRVLRLAGTVHDVGKIGVPAEILAKPTSLSPVEYQLVQTHAKRGYEILKDVDLPGPISEAIYQHHERMDGSGYPRGLSAGEILPEARILAVADVVESMASHRPYRPALGMTAALQEITGRRRVKFDADVVDALVRLVNIKHYRLPL